MRPKPNKTAATAAPLLPLEFTPFEYYYYLDDGPSYPTTFPIELHFSGPLDRAVFTAALRDAVERHPILSARADDSRRVPRWVAVESAEPHLQWSDADVPLAYPAGSTLDLRKQPGLRTWVCATPTSARVVFEFHHACCDGLAGLQFVQDVLALYRAGAAVPGAASAVRPLDAERLRHRGAIISDAARATSMFQGLRDAWYTFKVWAAILFRTPQVLAAPVRAELSQRRNPLAFDIATFTVEETTALRRSAMRQHVTTNDLLLRDLLLVLRSWNLDHGARAKGRLRVNVPVSVRTRAEAGLPAANRIGYGFVTTDLRDADNADRLLEVVCEETGRMKDWKLPLYFLGGLAFARNIPGLLPWAMRRRRSFATAVLSNVGRYVPDPAQASRDAPWTCGELTLEWIGGVPPVRPLTRAAAIVIEYAGRTSLCLRTDPHYFDAVAARTLLDAFAAQIRKTLGGNPD